MNFLEINNWVDFWYYIVGVIVILSILYMLQYSNYKYSISPPFSNKLIYITALFIAIYFVIEPIVIYSDKWLYQEDFLSVSLSHQIGDTLNKDIGFYYYTFVVSSITNSPLIYFFITAIVYMSGYIFFIKRKIISQYQFILFLGIISSLGFFGYGTNTIRAGLALSFFIIALTRKPGFNFSLIFLVLAVLFHKSLLMPVASWVLIRFYNDKNNFILLWVVCFFLSLFFGNTFVSMFGEFFNITDERVQAYAYNTDIAYKTGFRLDFVVYSIIPIIIAKLYQKKGYFDHFYNQLLSLYVICNAFWLLLIRIAFSDRFATLSWFLIPILLLYPLLQKKIFVHQTLYIYAILLGNVIINFILKS
jgi:hypothetical protein